MPFELSILATFGAMLSWGIGDFLIQRTVRKIGDLEALTFIGIIGSLALLPFVLKDLHFLLQTQNLIILLILGIITFLAAISDFEALKQGKLSVIEVILEIELPITIALGFIFFRETLTLVQAIIILLIFIGLILVATKSYHLKNFLKRLERGVIIGVVAAVAMGFVNFLTAVSAKNTSPLLAIWMPWVIFTIICIIFLVKRNDFSNLINNVKSYPSLIISMGIIDTLAWVFYAFAVVKNEISITTAITESYPAIALFLGLWFNHEKIDWHQYLGAALAIIASIILALSL